MLPLPTSLIPLSPGTSASQVYWHRLFPLFLIYTLCLLFLLSSSTSLLLILRLKTFLYTYNNTQPSSIAKKPCICCFFPKVPKSNFQNAIQALSPCSCFSCFCSRLEPIAIMRFWSSSCCYQLHWLLFD
jgi:hypothetical protein